jgi:hypothetical protein
VSEQPYLSFRKPPDQSSPTTKDLPTPDALRNIRPAIPKVVSEPFAHDVFLSHSAKDKAVVRDMAEWLQEYRPALITTAITGKIDVRTYSKANILTT